MLEDRSLYALLGRDGVVEGSGNPRHDAVHVAHLEQQPLRGSRLPVMRFVADRDAESDPLRLLKHANDGTVAVEEMFVAYGRGVLCLAAGVPEPILPFVRALRVGWWFRKARSNHAERRRLRALSRVH